MINQASLIGGIYGKQIAIGNLTHFFIGALALIKSVMKNPSGPPVIIAAIIYFIFAILFTWIFYKHPLAQENK